MRKKNEALSDKEKKIASEEINNIKKKHCMKHCFYARNSRSYLVG